MGILDNIFGGSSSNDDKYVMLCMFGFQLAMSDGKYDKEEGQMLGAFLANVPGMTKDRQRKIAQKAQYNIENDVEVFTADQMLNMSMDDKNEIINGLVAVSMADGHFHGEELVYIFMVGVSLGLDLEHLVGFLMENYDIDENEAKAAFERLGKWMKENGYSN